MHRGAGVGRLHEDRAAPHSPRTLERVRHHDGQPSLPSHSHHAAPARHTSQRHRKDKAPRKLIDISLKTAFCALLASAAPTAMAQSCISLANSAACPAFNASSISTNSNLTGLFPFLSSVTDVSSFDSGLRDYISGDFTQLR